jgi:hypothetical protein
MLTKARRFFDMIFCQKYFYHPYVLSPEFPLLFFRQSWLPPCSHEQRECIPLAEDCRSLAFIALLRQWDPKLLADDSRNKVSMTGTMQA